MKLIQACVGLALGLYACSGSNGVATAFPADNVQTATPIKHLVMIYGEDVSFDHYFGTYPSAMNPSGEPAFKATPGTPLVSGLRDRLLTANPNATNALNGTDTTNPFRLDRTQAATADQNRTYTTQQLAYDNGVGDLFPRYTGIGPSGGVSAFGTPGLVMGYFDGNTVTALWNYAQKFAMSDNAYTTGYGTSTPGALNLISGQTNGMKIVKTTKQSSTLAATSYYINDGQGGYTMINDVDPAYDLCSNTTDTVMMTGKNIGDLLNAQNITWGSFIGGFNLLTVNANRSTGCNRSTLATAVSASSTDYIPHHNGFQYYASTSNPRHERPSSIMAIGSSFEMDGKTPEPAHHEYDLDDFYAAIKIGNFPSVSFIKAPAAQDAHAGYSDPLDEQGFLTKLLNFLQQQPDWKSTAVIVTYDDSNSWYDHAYAKPVYASFDSAADQLNGGGTCGTGTASTGVKGKPINGRCGPGMRIPFLVISPWAKVNYVDHTRIDQASVLRFIEDNWLQGTRIGSGSFDTKAGSIMNMLDFSGGDEHDKLFLNPTSGTFLAPAPTM